MTKQDEKKAEGNVECTDQNMELDLDDLDDVAGGKSAPHHQGNRTPGLIGSQAVYDRMEQLRNHTFRR